MVMLMDCSAAAVTVNEKAFEVTPLKLAVMLTLPYLRRWPDRQC